MTALFDLCAACGHAWLDHDGAGCMGCRIDQDLHETFLRVPATAHLERELPVPVVCREFVAAARRNNYAAFIQGGEQEGEDSTPESGW